jgi:cell division septum initiation protein DivIVA
MLNLIDRLEALISEGTRIPMTARAMIDEREFADIIDQLRVSLPEELRQARRVIQERDRLLTEARAEGDRIMNTAQEQAAFMLQDTELSRAAERRAEATVSEANRRAADILEQANQEADAIVLAAQQQAAEVRQGADTYVRGVLMNLEDQLTKQMTMVRNGVAMLDRPTSNHGLR